MAFRSDKLIVERSAPVYLTLFVLLGVLGLPGPVSKAYGDGTKRDVTDAHYLDISDADLVALLDDPKHRVSEDFRVDPNLKGVVGFWLKIYAKYSLYHTLVYDRMRPEMLYEVVDNRQFFERGLSPVAIELSSKQRIKKAVTAYKAAFAVLQRNPRASFPAGTAGARILKLWGRKSAREWHAIGANLRTQPGQRDRIMQGMASADRFVPAMEAIFRKSGIPTEITRLPLVESSFVLQAKSKAAAVGVWQFLEKSALGDNLVVDYHHGIDERLSPIKSTAAAAKMFRRNYKILGDWNLAIIAYNHGPRNLVPIRKKYSGDNIVKLLLGAKNSPLGYASRNYLSEFWALLHADRYKDVLYGFPPTAHPDAISIVKIRKPASVFEIASLYNISVHELKLFNPDIFDLKKKLPAGTRVVLPRKHGESIVLAPKLDASETDGGARGIASEIDFIEYVK